MPKDKDNELLWTMEIQEFARKQLGEALKQAKPTVSVKGGLFWSADTSNQYHNAVNDCICALKLEYPRVLDIRYFVGEVSTRLLEQYKLNNGYQPDLGEENSAANLKNLHYQLKTKLQDKTDPESRTLLKTLTRCDPTSITVRHVQNYLEQKEGRDNFNDLEKKGIERLQSQIDNAKAGRSYSVSFRYARSASPAELSPPVVSLTTQPLRLE